MKQFHLILINILDYIDSKANAQKMLLEKHSKTGFPVIIINPTYMIGPFDSGSSSGEMILELWKDNIPGCSLGGKNFVWLQKSLVW